MVILFLDVDGVLNSHNYLNKTLHLPQIDIYKYLDPSKIQLLKEFVSTYHLEVVLHSTWRNAFNEQMIPTDELGKSLYTALNNEKIALLDKTPYLEGNRYLEISSWLKENVTKLSITNFVILDDANIEWNELKNHLVLTDEWIGLTHENIQAAKIILDETI